MSHPREHVELPKVASAGGGKGEAVRTNMTCFAFTASSLLISPTSLSIYWQSAVYLLLG